MGTTKDDLLAVVNQLIEDNENQSAAAQAKHEADATVIAALSAQNVSGINYATAQATVKSDIDRLLKTATDLADEDDAT